MFKLLSKQVPTTIHYQIFHFISRTKLFFKFNVVFLQFITVLAMIDSEFIQDSSSIKFFLLCFKPSKVDEKVFIVSFFAKFSQCSFKVKTFAFNIFFKVGSSNISFGNLMRINEFFKYLSNLISSSMSLFKLNVCIPSVFFWLPSHPRLKNSSCVFNVSQNLFHVTILEPKLIDSWHQRTSSFPDVSCMIDKLILHFHLSIF